MQPARFGDSRGSLPPPPAMPFALWPRVHMFELHEQAWVPGVLRRAATDYLATVIDLADPFGPLVPRLVALCKQTNATRFVDLCAGASVRGCVYTAACLPSSATRCR